ncbi:MAG: hypothetical protein ACTHWA_05435 [Arachnia sp.]
MDRSHRTRLPAAPQGTWPVVIAPLVLVGNVFEVMTSREIIQAIMADEVCSRSDDDVA